VAYGITKGKGNFEDVLQGAGEGEKKKKGPNGEPTGTGGRRMLQGKIEKCCLQPLRGP